MGAVRADSSPTVDLSARTTTPSAIHMPPRSIPYAVNNPG